MPNTYSNHPEVVLQQITFNVCSKYGDNNIAVKKIRSAVDAHAQRDALKDLLINKGIRSSIHRVKSGTRRSFKRRARQCTAATPVDVVAYATALFDRWRIGSKLLIDMTKDEILELIDTTRREGRGVFANLYFFQSLYSQMADGQTVGQAFPNRSKIPKLWHVAELKAFKLN